MLLVRGLDLPNKTGFVSYLLNMGVIHKIVEGRVEVYSEGLVPQKSYIPVTDEALSNTRSALADGKRVAVCDEFVSVWEMEEYFKLALEYGIVPTVIIAELHNDETTYNNLDWVTMRKKQKFEEDATPLIDKYELLLKEKQNDK